ncbi:MAG: aromatic-ring-hydroxylating dioxygenase subunit beta [Burkholderiaceae bacterium]
MPEHPLAPTGMPVAAPAWASELIAREAHFLDHRRWDDWLALYAADARFWVPAWLDDERIGDDPDRAVSLIYCTSREALADRVWRLRSGLSVASSPLPRTAHVLGVPLVTGRDHESLSLCSAFSSHVWYLRAQRQHVFFGHVTHRLVGEGSEARIAAKTIVLANDRVPTMLDFYCV